MRLGRALRKCLGEPRAEVLAHQRMRIDQLRLVHARPVDEAGLAQPFQHRGVAGAL